MHLNKLAVRNFRMLQEVIIGLASDISVFVGANNSGKDLSRPRAPAAHRARPLQHP
jgi:hypothetical protein